MNLKLVLRGLALLAALAAVGFLMETLDVDKAWIDADVRGRGMVGDLAFVAVLAVFTAIGLPRQVAAFLGGYAFGFAAGTALSLAATVMGCAIAFSYARFMGRDFVKSRFPGRVRRIDDFLSDNPFTMTLLIRFLPAGSNLVTNLVAGVSGVAALPFLAGSGLGYIPQMVVFALLGSGISVDPALRIALAVALFVVSGLIGVQLYRKHRHGKSFDDRVEREIGAD